MIAGKDAPNFGQAKNSWLTGTAAWNFYVISNYILGIKPDWEGLKVIPCRNSLSNFHFLSYLYVKQVIRNPIHLRHCPGTRHADVHAAAPLSHLSLESPE